MDWLLDILSQGVPWLAALAGLTLSFLCSAVETGSYRLNRIRLRLRVDAGDRRAATLLTLLRDMRGLIVAILVSNNVANYVVAAAVTTLVAAAFTAQSDLVVQLLATAIVTPVLFVFCEVLPKNLFIFNPESRMLPLAGAIRTAKRLLTYVGLVPALKGVSSLVLRIAGAAGGGANPFNPRQRLRALFRESAAEGVISGYQSELVEKVLTLREKTVREVMIPMARVATVAVGVGREAFIEELRRHSYSRLPVWEGRRDHIVGIVRINDVLAMGEGSLDLPAAMSRDFLSMAPQITVSQAMFRMRKARAAMAIVIDGKGRAVGIITVKDLVEEIIGELAAW